MDAFKTLIGGGGTRFNRKKYKSDFEIFQQQSALESSSKDQDSNPDASNVKDSFGNESTQLHKSLDFFQDANDVSNHSRDEKQDVKNIIAKKESETHDIVYLKNENEANSYRKLHNIRVYGTDVPYPLTSFHELVDRFQLVPFIRKNIQSLAFPSPSSIQKQSIPVILHGRDIMACAPTGSGKTLAFLIPIIQLLKSPSKEGCRALIITPTRELAQQIHRELKKLIQGRSFKVCVLTKSINLKSENNAPAAKNFDFLISTPLRLVTAIQHEQIDLASIQHLVLDEADKLLELGFLDQMDDIFASCSHPKLQKLLFSATIPSGVEQLASSVMKDAIRIVIGAKNAATDTIDQKLLYVGQEEGKLIAIRQLIAEGMKPPVLIFVQSIDRAKELFHELVYDGINVDVIHSERTKAQRDAIVSNFRQGQIWVLIATELMARGIDFKGVNLVINYDFPQSVQSYIHRIGRTGRAGRQGTAITYFTKDDSPYLKSIVNVMRESGCDVPEWMLKLKAPSKNMKKALKLKPVQRDAIKTVSSYDDKKKKRKTEMIQASKRRKLKNEVAPDRKDLKETF